MSTPADTVALAAGRWTCVSARTAAQFAVRNFGVGTVRGTVPVREAWVEADSGGTPTVVRALLDLTGIDTGNVRRYRDLRAPYLLDTERHPVLGFRGGPAVRTAAGIWTVPGRLSCRGNSADVLLEVTTSATAHDELIVHATTELDRQSLGIRAPALLIGRRLQVTVDAALVSPASSGSD